MRLFIAEEQGLLRSVYESYFSASPDFQLAGVSPEVSAEALTRAGNAFRPDAMIIGARVARGGVVDAVRRLHGTLPGMTVVVLSSSYDLLAAQGVLAHLQQVSTGFAFLMKDTVDSVEDLARITQVSAAGHIVVDPGLMRDLIGVLNEYAAFFKLLSPRDMEVLDLMAKGHSDGAIAHELGLPVRAVEEQIEAIYQKTGARSAGTWDPRVHTITTYLKAAGILPVRDFRIGAAQEVPGEVEVLPSPSRPSGEDGDAPPGPSTVPIARAPLDDDPVDDGDEGVVMEAPRHDADPSGRPTQEMPWDRPGTGRPFSGSAANGYSVDAGRVGRSVPSTNEEQGRDAGFDEVLDNVVQRYGSEALRDFEEFAASGRSPDVKVAARILDWAAHRHLKVRFGRGRLEGSFSVSLEISGIAFWLISVWAIGAVEVQFQMLEAQRPFADERKRLELARRLERVPGVSVSPDALSGRPRVPLSALREPEGFNQFVQTMNWVVETISQAWAAKS